MSKKPRNKKPTRQKTVRVPPSHDWNAEIIGRVCMVLNELFEEEVFLNSFGEECVIYNIEYNIDNYILPKSVWDKPTITPDDVAKVIYPHFEKDIDEIHLDVYNILVNRVINRLPHLTSLKLKFVMSGQSIYDFLLDVMCTLVRINMELVDCVIRSNIELVEEYN